MCAGAASIAIVLVRLPPKVISGNVFVLRFSTVTDTSTAKYDITAIIIIAIVVRFIAGF